MANNRFRFAGFSEKISRIKIDVYHKVGEVRELSETTDDTYFKEALIKWKDLNCTKDFHAFRNEIWGKVQDLRQIIYHQDEIIKILCRHLLVRNSQCYDALLDLAAQIAKDLRNEFYPHFADIFEVIVKLLDVHDAEVIEQVFTCMAYIFKYCWRYMIPDYERVYGMYKKLLHTSQKPHVRQFAAESISFLVRKLNDKNGFLDTVFMSASEDSCLVEGIGCLLFEIIKGVTSKFHSCTRDVILTLLKKLEPTYPSNIMVFDCLSLMLKAAAKHTTEEHVHVLWECLLSEIISTNESLQNQLKTLDTASCEKLNHLLKLLKLMVDWKSGTLLLNFWNKLLQAIENVIKPKPLEDIADSLLDLLSSLLTVDIPELKKEHLKKIVKQIFCSNFKVEQISNFICAVRNCQSFEAIVLSEFYRYAESVLVSEKKLTSSKASLLLRLLSENITEKTDLFRMPYSDPLEEHHFASFYGKDRRKKTTDAVRMLIEKMLEVISECGDQSSDIHLLDTAHSCVVCLPFLRPDTDLALSCLITSLKKWVEKAESSNDSQMWLFLISQAMRSIFLLQNSSDLMASSDLEHETILSLLSRFPRNILVLGAYDCYCRIIKHQASDLLLMKRSEQLYSLLKCNLSSSLPIIRLLTLRILSYYKRPFVEDSDTTETTDSRFGVIGECLAAEEVPATFERYLEKLMHLRKLTYSTIQQLPDKQFYNDVIVRFLIGNLLINLRPMWDPVMEILQTYANEQNTNSLWAVYSGLIKSAFATKEPDSEKARDVTETTDLPEVDNNEIQFIKSKNLIDVEDSLHLVDRSTICLLMCQSMEKFPSVAERKSRDILPLFFEFLSKEYEKFDTTFVAHQNILNTKSKDHPMLNESEAEDDSEQANEPNMDSKSHNLSHQKKKILISFLKLFGKFKNPKALYMETKLNKLYLELLCHHDNEIQSLAFSCLKTYKFPYLKPYEENVEKLLQDNTFKDELTLFSSSNENGIVKPEDRIEVMKIVIRLLFGRLQRRSGLGISGKKNQNARRNILINFISNCCENDVDIFIELVTEPFREFSSSGETERSHPDLEKMIPLRKQLGYINMLKTILTRLSQSVTKHVTNLFKILLEILGMSVTCLSQRENIEAFCVGQLKSIRQLSIARLIGFMETFPEFDFTCFSGKIFKCTIVPQIANMQQEAHQVTPLLKLIHCWSNYPQYQPWLEKSVSVDQNETVLYHVFSILKCPKKSTEVVQMIMSIAENLIQIGNSEGEMDCESPRIIAKYLDLLFAHLSEVIKSHKSIKASKPNNKSNTFQMELNILAQISLFVKEPEQCQTVINILFPTLKTTKDENVQISTLKTIKNLLANSSTAKLPLGSLSMLFLSLKEKLSRVLLCDIYEIVAGRDEELNITKDFIQDMNSWNPKRLEEPDYERRLKAFSDFSDMLTNGNISSKHIKPLLCNCIHFSLESNDISIRDASLSCISHTINLVFDKREMFDDLIQGFLISHIKAAIRSKNEIVRNEYIQLLSMIVQKFDESIVSDMKTLTSVDPEMDFFENIRHIQVHRRIKALRQLALCTEEGQLRLNSLYNFLLPMISHFIFEHALAKEHNIVSETILAIGCITGRLTWQKYSHVLKSYLRLLSKEQTKQKTVLRIVVAILNAFPFNLSVLDEDGGSHSSQLSSVDVESKDKQSQKTDQQREDTCNDIEMQEATERQGENEESDNDDELTGNEIVTPAEETKNDDITLAKKIHKAISSNILPLLRTSLTQKSFVEDFHRKSHNKEVDNEEILRVPLALAMVKLLQQLPKSTLHEFLPGLLLRVCQSLRSRARDVRETARTTLVKIASSLGPTYLPYVLREMMSVLKRGYQLHVLSYTLKAVLDGLTDQLSPGDINGCLKSILEVLMNDIFSNVAEEKESEGVKENLHEAKSKQSYDSFEIIAKFASAESFEDIVNAVQKLLETEHNHTVRNKAKEVLRRVSLGFQKNSSLSQKDLLVFVYHIIVDLKPLESNTETRQTESTKKRVVTEDIFLIKSEPGRMAQAADRDKSANSHLLTEFALQLLFSLLKRYRQQKLTQDNLELFDPFVEALIGCLKSKYNQVVHLGTKSLSLLVQLPLPSVSKNINLLAASLFKLLKKYGRIRTGTDENRELVGSAFKAMTVLLRNGNKCKATDDQLKTLLVLVEEDIYDHTRQGTAFPLLKAILSRKLDVPEMHEIIEKIGNLSITNDSQSVQLQCRQIMLQYLLDYPLGKKSDTYLEFYVNQLEYEWENGRQSALEMVALIFKHFPQKRLQEYACFFFVPLAMRLINDDSPLCRKLTVAVISTLLEKLDTELRTELFGLILNWLQQEKVSLKRLATQIIGTFAEVEKNGFERRLPGLLPLIKDDLKLESDMNEENDAADQLVFFTLNTLKKIFQNCQAIRNTQIQEPLNEIWNNIQDLLKHPHTWIRLASCQLFGQLFAAWPNDEIVKISQKDVSKCLYLAEDLSSKVRQLCINFCDQMKDDVGTELGEQITKNLIYLSKIINCMEHESYTGDVEFENESNAAEDRNSKKLSLKWLLHKMSYLASHEASQSQNSSSKRTCVFRWLAAISIDLGSERIQYILPEILQPLHRETVSLVSSDPELQKLAKEVISLIREIVGKETFAESYSKMQRKVTSKKESRKRQRLEEAIKDQEKFALKKAKRTAAKQDQKKRKLLKKKY